MQHIGSLGPAIRFAFFHALSEAGFFENRFQSNNIEWDEWNHTIQLSDLLDNLSSPSKNVDRKVNPQAFIAKLKEALMKKDRS